MTTTGNVDLDEVAARIARVLASTASGDGREGLNTLEQRLSVALYRLLAEGHPVPRSLLAERLPGPLNTVDEILDRWPGVFSDVERRVVGYWGLALPVAYASPHRLTINGRTLSAWCAWDTLFLPQLLGETAEVESTTPAGGAIVRLTVASDRVVHIDPVDAHMSFLLPDAANVQRDVVTTFCHFVHFFPSREAGERWAAEHDGTFLLTIEEAHTVALRKNAELYPELFRVPARP